MHFITISISFPANPNDRIICSYGFSHQFFQSRVLVKTCCPSFRRRDLKFSSFRVLSWFYCVLNPPFLVCSGPSWAASCPMCPKMVLALSISGPTRHCTWFVLPPHAFNARAISDFKYCGGFHTNLLEPFESCKSRYSIFLLIFFYCCVNKFFCAVHGEECGGGPIRGRAYTCNTLIVAISPLN